MLSGRTWATRSRRCSSIVVKLGPDWRVGIHRWRWRCLILRLPSLIMLAYLLVFLAMFSCQMCYEVGHAALCSLDW